MGNASKTKLDKVVIRIAGDSGDGMQLAGDQFTSEAAAFGNDLATQPNFPAEIRAPQGTIHGVSSFQIQIADYDILTAGDRPDVLVAMNPAALKANVEDLPAGGILIVNSDDYTREYTGLHTQFTYRIGDRLNLQKVRVGEGLRFWGAKPDKRQTG